MSSAMITTMFGRCWSTSGSRLIGVDRSSGVPPGSAPGSSCAAAEGEVSEAEAPVDEVSVDAVPADEAAPATSSTRIESNATTTAGAERRRRIERSSGEEGGGVGIAMLRNRW